LGSRKKPAMFGRGVYVIVGIVCLVNQDRVFLESLDAPIGTGSCALTCTPGLLQPVHTFPALVQPCTACFALGGISNVGGACGCLRLGICKVCWAPLRNRRPERVGDDIVCTAARSFVPFLFPPTGVMRLGIFEAGLCIACQREGVIREWRRIKDRVFCLLVQNGTSR